MKTKFLFAIRILIAAVFGMVLAVLFCIDISILADIFGVHLSDNIYPPIFLVTFPFLVSVLIREKNVQGTLYRAFLIGTILCAIILLKVSLTAIDISNEVKGLQKVEKQAVWPHQKLGIAIGSFLLLLFSIKIFLYFFSNSIKEIKILSCCLR